MRIKYYKKQYDIQYLKSAETGCRSDFCRMHLLMPVEMVKAVPVFNVSCMLKDYFLYEGIGLNHFNATWYVSAIALTFFIYA